MAQDRVRVVRAPSRLATGLTTGALVVLTSAATGVLVLSSTSGVGPGPASRPGADVRAAPAPAAVLVVPPRPASPGRSPGQTPDGSTGPDRR